MGPALGRFCAVGLPRTGILPLNPCAAGFILRRKGQDLRSRRVTHDRAPLALAEIHRHFGVEAVVVEPLGAGLINQTFVVQAADGHRYVLQRLHDIFPATVNDDIEAVTARLEDRGMTTPRLLRTLSGELSVARPDGIWRMMTFIPGISVERVDTGARAREAGRLLGRFHAALADLEYRFSGARTGIHDTAGHLGNLRRALDMHRDHPAYDTVLPVAESVLAAADSLAPLPVLPDHVVHGDPKISNFIFDAETGCGVCMVDLDTLNRMPLPLELGDALRSWCNPAGEDTCATAFSVGYFRQALSGYASAAGSLIRPAEAACVVCATLTIQVELAARFCADALNESYFGWDPARFASRSDHNRVRAEGQIAAWKACSSRADDLTVIVGEVFRGDNV